MKNLTELVFILDRSGSMRGLEEDTIGGFNSMIAKQKKEEGEAVVTTVLFDSQYELLHDRIALNGIADMTEKEYYARGCTALLDAMGITIQKIKNVQMHTKEEERANKVIFIIITDGMENSSREYSASAVKKMVEEQKKEGWEFLFLGANIDAVREAARFGIQEDRAVTYCNDSQGVKLNYESVSEAVGCVRKNRKLSSSWKCDIEEDMRKRSQPTRNPEQQRTQRKTGLFSSHKK